MKRNGFVLAALLGFGMVVGPVSAATTTFTASGTAGDGSPEHAQADFTFNGSFSSLSLTLTNTAGPGELQHIASVLDGIEFSMSGQPLTALSLSSLSDPNGTVTCGGHPGSCSFSATPVNLATSQWGFNSSTGLLAAGNGSFKPYGIVNTNVQAMDGITNAQHNPLLVGPVTFNFSILNPNNTPLHLTSASFYFGTGPDTVTITSPIPEPETYGLLLAGLGLMGFVARRRIQRPENAGA